MAGVTERTKGAIVAGELLIEDDDLQGVARIKEVTIEEQGAAGVYTGAVKIPAGATIINIRVRNVVVWGAGTSATLIVGDVATDNGYYTAVNMKITDLPVGEELSFEHQGGKNGAYLDDSTGKQNTYSASSRVITAKITTVGATSSAGRTRVIVEYVLPAAAGIVVADYAPTG